MRYITYRYHVAWMTNRRLSARLQQRYMIAHLEQYVRFRRKRHGGALSQGKDFPEQVGSSTKVETLYSTMGLGMTGEGGGGGCKLSAGK
jgi:hypothetical protein